MIEELRDLIKGVDQTGCKRTPENIPRRLIKIMEEIGELTEAYLGITCSANYKNKTIEDVRSEAIDCWVVMVDCALTALPYSKHPPSSLLPHVIEDGIQRPVMVADIAGIIFEVARLVGVAREGFYENNDMRFYGSLSKAINNISRICFTSFEGEDGFEIMQLTTKRQLAKWQVILDKITESERYEAA